MRVCLDKGEDDNDDNNDGGDHAQRGKKGGVGEVGEGGVKEGKQLAKAGWTKKRRTMGQMQPKDSHKTLELCAPI